MLEVAMDEQPSVVEGCKILWRGGERILRRESRLHTSGSPDPPNNATDDAHYLPLDLPGQP
jgi:hypothetical protein